MKTLKTCPVLLSSNSNTEVWSVEMQAVKVMFKVLCISSGLMTNLDSRDPSPYHSWTVLSSGFFQNVENSTFARPFETF